MTPDVLVLGTGRSGTSFAAQVLHEQWGVCFGHVKIGTEFRGEVVYEDGALKEALFKVTRERRTVAWWLEQFRANHGECEASLRGIKLLDLSLLTPEQVREMRPRLIVRTWRPRDSCVESWMRYNGRSRDWAERYYDDRETRIGQIVARVGAPVARLNFCPETHKASHGETVAALQHDVDAHLHIAKAAQ